MRQKLEAIYRDHRQGLFTLALSITGSADRAEDAVHDAFARLCRGDTTPAGDPVAYAFAAVRNAAIDQRRRRREVTLSWGQSAAGEDDRVADAVVAGAEGGAVAGNIFAGGSMGTTSAADPACGASDRAVIEAETSSLVQRAIAQLPEPAREVLVMKIYTGLTFEQIAEALGQPLSTVASRYRRTLEKLKEQLSAVV